MAPRPRPGEPASLQHGGRPDGRPKCGEPSRPAGSARSSRRPRTVCQLAAELRSPTLATLLHAGDLSERRRHRARDAALHASWRRSFWRSLRGAGGGKSKLGVVRAVTGRSSHASRLARAPAVRPGRRARSADATSYSRSVLAVEGPAAGQPQYRSGNGGPMAGPGLACAPG
jgi:hypothetical protein